MQRNYLYDNTTFLVIFLVVFGHLLEPLAGQGGGGPGAIPEHLFLFICRSSFCCAVC